MNRSPWAMIVPLSCVLALGACTSARFGDPFGPPPLRGAASGPVYAPVPEPVEPVPSGPVVAEPLPPLEGPGAGQGAISPAPGSSNIMAGLPPPPAAPPPVMAPAGRSAVVGGWSARDASGSSCRVQLSSSPALDLYRASASGCANKDLARVTAWDFRDGEVYLYQPGGAVAARLRAGSGSMQGVLTKSGAPLTLSR